MLSSDMFGPARLDLAGDGTEGTTRILACGAVGTRQGRMEVSFRRFPALG
ncbi:hypothetical protein [Jannaschia rubra]|uniref:Uncharacterized protein n=1 Tax=Jannaschia rubra TaxID=282197 RepID=A0A0M6XLE1_9RHOB|nr:hypothetical protein [Jannaschia rubra]CTQ31482.1 hypothetical protein JAN5088_00240 [Jannaschia rubra]SFF78556.1 hypothetical protein SAMN04488517_101177 [Jannaschia rubra]